MGRILKSCIVTATLTMVSTAAQAGDAVKGQMVFRGACSNCHSVAAHASPGLGPSLLGIVGRKAGTFPKYKYSEAMLASGLTWTPSQLTTYLAAPSKTVPKTKMTYGGVKDPIKLQNLVAYLTTVK